MPFDPLAYVFAAGRDVKPHKGGNKPASPAKAKQKASRKRAQAAQRRNR